MITVGTTISETKVKVDGCFVDGSQVNVITAVNPPNPPIDIIGKDSVLYLNPVIGQLFWDYVDRPLTDSEKITQFGMVQTKVVDTLVTITGVTL